MDAQHGASTQRNVRNEIQLSVQRGGRQELQHRIKQVPMQMSKSGHYVIPYDKFAGATKAEHTTVFVTDHAVEHPENQQQAN